MATREENIKKINEELEKMSDEELEKVAGGRYFLSPNVGDVEKEPVVNIKKQGQTTYNNHISF